MASVVILHHLLAREKPTSYMVHAFAEHWRAAGHRVVEHYGWEAAPPADVAIMHLDLTVVPQNYRELVGRYARVVNGTALDTSKRHFSAQMVDRASNWRGPVIVKTDTNVGGLAEQVLRNRAARLGMASDVAPGPVLTDYPRFRSLAEVPESVWQTRGLIVEKFLPERDEHGYYLRSCIFFGNREYSYRGIASQQVMKLRDLRDTHEVPIPQEIRAWRARLGVDFGSFDYAWSGGRFVLFDVNRTPGLGPTSSVRLKPHLGPLAAGLEAFLRT